MLPLFYCPQIQDRLGAKITLTFPQAEIKIDKKIPKSLASPFRQQFENKKMAFSLFSSVFHIQASIMY